MDNDTTTGTNNNFYIILAGVGFLVIIFIFFCCIYNNKPSTNNTASGSDQNIVKIEMPLDEIPLDEIPLDEIQLDEMPLDEIQLDEMPLDEIQLDEMPLDEIPSHIASQQASLDASHIASQQASFYAPIIASQQASLDAFQIITLTDINNIYGLYARYQADNYNTYTNIWSDSSPNNNHITSVNITNNGLAKIQANNNNTLFNVLNGRSKTEIKILSTPIINYTLIHICRYSGGIKQRIITGNTVNWISGFHSGNTGVFMYDQRLTRFINWYDNNWFISVNTPYDYLSNGISKKNTDFNKPVLPEFGINTNGIGMANKSDFQVAEVIIFNRVLSSSEILAINKILSNNYGITLENLSIPPTYSLIIPSSNTDINSMFGLYARYEANYYNSYIWYDSSINNRHINSNTDLLIKSVTNNSKTFNILEGTINTTIIFTTIKISFYTLIYICRYAPDAITANKKRIFSSNEQWLSGFWEGKSGISLIPPNNFRCGDSDLHGQDWFIAVDTNYDYLTNNTSRIITNIVHYLPPFGINNSSTEKSDFQVAEVIIFDRVLSSSEIIAINRILSNKYNISLGNSSS